MFFAQDPTNSFYYLGAEEPNSRILNGLLDNPPRLVACDVESISLKEKIPIGISIATSPSTAFYFQLFPIESNVVPWNLLKDPTITTIWHNGIFDLDCLVAYNIKQDIQDTNIMARLQAYKSNSLIGLSWLHQMEIHEASDMLKEAGAKTMLDLPPDAVARKCMQDAMATFKLYLELLPKTDLPYYNVERATIPIMLRMSYRGIALDQPMRAMIEQGLESEVTRLRNICDETEMFNPGSPQQVSYILAKRGAYNVFPRLPFTKNRFGRNTGSLSTDVDVLKAMDDPLAQIILEYRMNTKLLSTYIRPWAGKDRAHTMYHLDAITGRPSSTSGGDLADFRNMQNIPGKFRKDGTEYPYNCRGCLLPDTGAWTDVDLEQVEPRALAYLSGDKDMNYIFSQPKYLPDGSRNEEGDIHLQVANFMGIDRRLGKTINLAMTYGATDETLMDESGIRSRGRIQQLKRMWAEKFPRAWDWIESRQEDALRTGIAVTVFGRKMRLPTLDEESADGIKRKAVDYPCQGTAADILKRSLIALQDMDLALQEHDELLIDGFEPKEKFEVMEHIAPFYTPLEIKYLSHWE